MSQVDDHGLEVIKKSAEYTEPLSSSPKKDYYIKVGGAPSGASYVIPPIPVSVDPVTTPTIFNVTATLANTEYSQALPSDTKKLLLRCRGLSRIQFSFASGGTNTNYITIRPGTVYSVEGLSLSSSTIYFETSLAGQVVEILTWT